MALLPHRRYPALRGGALEARRVPQCVVVFMVGGVTYAEARAHAPSPSGRRFDLLNQSNHKIQSHRLSQTKSQNEESLKVWNFLAFVWKHASHVFCRAQTYF